ncbi:TrkA family potassium uptake protein [Eubacteriaceae bacterium ES3]|nr:TrkA family potassium uptake protein [Eubacteriaceae bacterium ES3]
MRIIIVGCGRIGSGLAKRLGQDDVGLAVIDQDPRTFSHLEKDFKGTQITGVGFDRDVLLKAGIEQCDALAAVTSNDEANVLIARIARLFFNVPRVVCALHDPRKSDIYNRLGLLVFDPMSWGVNRVADLISFSHFNVSMSIGNVDILEIEIPTLLVGRKVADLSIPGEISVISINRGNQTLIPLLNTTFENRDRLHLVVSSLSVNKLESLLGL